MLFPLVDVLTDQETIFPQAVHDLPSSVVYTNEQNYDPEWTRHVLTHAYTARTVTSEPIVLGRLPRQTVLCGEHYFILRLHGRVAQESLPHALLLNPSLAVAEIERYRFVVAEPLGEECVLLTRWGFGTWGHWLGEIVPIAAILERRYPGRFRYAVPLQGTTLYGAAALDSLHAYGIEPDRIITILPGEPRALTHAWAVTPIWSDHSPHPAALDVMRGSVRLSTYQNAPKKIALMRRDWPTRGIANSAEVERFLSAKGFQITDAAHLPFLAQVRMFQSAKVVFAVVGSGLTGLIYAPNNVAVMAAGPAKWGDRFFYALAQHRRGVWSEVRGPSEWDGNGNMRDASFTVPMAALEEGLNRLQDSVGGCLAGDEALRSVCPDD